MLLEVLAVRSHTLSPGGEDPFSKMQAFLQSRELAVPKELGGRIGTPFCWLASLHASLSFVETTPPTAQDGLARLYCRGQPWTCDPHTFPPWHWNLRQALPRLALDKTFRTKPRALGQHYDS